MNPEGAGRLGRRLWPLVKFCMVGVVNTALSYGIYLVLQTFLPYLVAHVTSWYVGCCASFFMNCHFTYQVKPTRRGFWLFPLSSVPNVILSTTGVLVLVEVARIDQRLAPLIATLAAIPLSYLLARRILVRTGPPTDPESASRAGRRRDRRSPAGSRGRQRRPGSPRPESLA